MSDSANTILLAPADAHITVKEALAGGAITPGHLLEKTSTGTVVVHNSSNVAAQKMFALENLPVAGGIADAYASGDTVRYAILKSGDEVNVLVADGTSAIVKGVFLTSNGDGTVVTVTDTAGVTPLDSVIIGTALESVDNSGGSVDVRIKMEVA